jgi:ABC-type transport system involved in cytochrome bd biosynthesis fused ATPase/permease subunit
MPPRSRDDEFVCKRAVFRWVLVFAPASLVAASATSVLDLSGTSVLLGSLLVLALFVYFFVLPTFSAGLMATWKKDEPSERELLASAGFAVIRGPGRRVRSNSRLASKV